MCVGRDMLHQSYWRLVGPVCFDVRADIKTTQVQHLDPTVSQLWKIVLSREQSSTLKRISTNYNPISDSTPVANAIPVMIP
jgi:hypothetical protein